MMKLCLMVRKCDLFAWTEIPAQYFLPAGAIAGIKDAVKLKVGDGFG